jgi:isopenicillin-N N-acyltransferase like protein
MTLPLVQLHGTAYEQGLQHGRVLRERIAANLGIYMARFARELKIGREEALARASHYAQAVATQSPAYYSGMEGIAEGSGFSFEEIAALNMRYELFYHQFGVIASGGDGCTAFALQPAVTATGHLLIGENWDWISGVQGAVLHTFEADGLQTLSFSEAGIFGGKIGLNSTGLGLAINGLVSSRDDWSRLHKPFHVRCYEILRSRSFADAIKIVTDGERSCSTNFLLAQVPDQVVNIEAAPHATLLSECQQGCLIHANHFVDPAALAIVEPPVEKTPHSYHRQARLEKLLRSVGRPLTVEDTQEALRDHLEHPYSVCFHIDQNEPPEEHYETLTSVVMDLHAQELYLTDGTPCTAAFARYAIV